MKLCQHTRQAWGIPVMAMSGGIIVANLYYNQPILHNIAESLQVPDSSIGRMSMTAQMGYGLGMLLLVPLGDMLHRKKLIVTICLLLCTTLLLTAASHRASTILLLSFFTGLFSTPAQIILPMAAALGRENRGKTVGQVYSGILCGMLGSRVLSGLITTWLGWEYVFLFSAILVCVAIVLLVLFLPEIPPKFKGSYGGLLKSTLSLIKEYPVLRQSALLGAFTFGAFCSFWTTVTFHLSGAPFHYSTAQIGLFGIIAIGGALVAPAFGKAADKGSVFRGLYLSVGMMAASILLLKMFPYSTTILIAGIFFLDIGVQATQITNFTRIYALNEHAHSRLNTVYMTTYFIGAAIGTGFGLLSWRLGGWNMATWQMLIWSLIALAIVAVSQRKSAAAALLHKA
ncbi:Predicted arabinose efflux permease, MFS family [Chitinophaga jiangningensis]|uniref:Predicted arabinose efflux permease, MFS family n=1 Tax=Chitinophaga jiangningensis TaxID=1419482 RepID=A0A1M7MW69_9BACT|nr:MFS transporter [Chitinophaga jiangningensis]SHM94843.1 Predicted arabinose efflux permease, MFS family [Chitinophaga jiangningensis]